MNFAPGNLTRFARPRIFQVTLLVLLMMTLASASFAGVFISVTIAPPPLPVYVQPPCPEPGFIWAPGYWAWGPFGYYWVPGTWVLAPEPGLYWTPGYWGWEGGSYIWNGGYWGPHVGFYGGVNYGFGFFGVGFVGGEWRGRDFFYNRAVVNVNQTNITNVFVNNTVIVNNENHVSFNGPGGIQRAANQQEQVAARENHIQPTIQQTRHVTQAQNNPQLLARNNGGRPPVAATVRPADFSPRSVTPARAAGGRVDPTVLRATPKSMPPPSRNPGFAGSANRGAPANTGPATRGENPTPGNRNLGRTPETGGNRPFTAPGRPNAAPERTNPRTESRPAPSRQPEFNPRTESRPTPSRPGTESRPAPSRPEFNPRTESRPAPSRPEFNPRSESRPAPSRQPEFNPRTESRPAPSRQPEFNPPRNQAPPRMESRPAPERAARPAPPPPAHNNAPARPEKAAPGKDKEKQNREQFR